jgi:hypothetical protein
MKTSARRKKMTDEDFYHECALRAMEMLLSKVPVPSLPGGNQDHFARQQFVRGLARDAFEIALSMLGEKRSYPTPAPVQMNQGYIAQAAGPNPHGFVEAVRMADVQADPAASAVTPG